MIRSRPSSDRAHYERLIADLLQGDPEVRAAAPRPEVRAAAMRPGLSLAESVAAIMEGYADRPALGIPHVMPDLIRKYATDLRGLGLPDDTVKIGKAEAGATCFSAECRANGTKATVLVTFGRFTDRLFWPESQGRTLAMCDADAGQTIRHLRSRHPEIAILGEP